MNATGCFLVTVLVELEASNASAAIARAAWALSPALGMLSVASPPHVQAERVEGAVPVRYRVTFRWAGPQEGEA